MEIPKRLAPILGLIVSTLVVFGSMNLWLLTVSSPFFIFLVFKMFGVWRTKERVVYGVPAIILGVMLFFLAFSFHVVGIPQGDFENENHTLHATIVPYSTENPGEEFDITVNYSGATDRELLFSVRDVQSGIIVDRGSVEGIVEGNKTIYNFTINPDPGLYDITLSVGNESLVISAVKTTPTNLFLVYMRTSGLMISMLLTGLYLLLLYGIHVVRVGYGLGKKSEE